MNTRFKTTTAETVPRTLGRHVGILPLGPRATVPPGQRKTNSLERRILKRTSSTGSVGPLSSHYKRPEAVSADIRKRSGSRRSQNEKEELEQEIRLIDSVAAVSSSAGGQRSTSSRQRKKTLTTSDILKICLETEPSKVFEIDLHGKELTSAPDLEQFYKLRILDFSGNYIKRISCLDSNKDLRELKMYDNDISAIDGLEHLKELCCLQLQHNKITAIGHGLSSLKKLQYLRLDNNQISRLETPELLSCSKMTTLDLSHNRLESLAPLSYLPNLEELFAAGNRIKKTGDLTKCKKLQEVDLSRNQISDLSGLANLPNLQILDISDNQVKTLKSVGKLRSIEELNINGNEVEELSSFTSLFPNLQILFICNNLICKWDEICSLSGCLDLVELYVTDNPFSKEDGEMPEYHDTISQTLPRLEVIDGVTLKRSNVKQNSTPVMRPMSASSIVSVRQVDSQVVSVHQVDSQVVSVHQVDSQMKAVTEEQGSLLRTITERFDALRTLVESLPPESPRPRTAASIVTNSRCSSRSRLQEAQNFAARNFDGVEGGGNL